MNLREKLLTSTDVTTIGYQSYKTEDMLADPAGFARVCVDPLHIFTARQAGFRVSAVVGFPFGTATTKQVEDCILDGAQELDLPIPVEIAATTLPNLSGGVHRLVTWLEHLDLPHHPDITYKFILHTDLIQQVYGANAINLVETLADTLKIVLGSIYRDGNLVVKTCTGYGPGKADPEIVQMLTNQGYRVKASGGIKTAEDAVILFEAGAEFLGIGFSSFQKILESLGEEDGSEGTRRSDNL